jgi:hypothetical protein
LLLATALLLILLWFWWQQLRRQPPDQTRLYLYVIPVVIGAAVLYDTLAAVK